MKVKTQIKVIIDNDVYIRVSPTRWYYHGNLLVSYMGLEEQYQDHMKENTMLDMDGDVISVGDLLMDAGSDRSDIRCKKLVRVEYVDKWNIVWKPLEGFDFDNTASWMWRDRLIVTREEWEKRQTQP